MDLFNLVLWAFVGRLPRPTFMPGLTSKRGCHCNYVAKQLYIDNTLSEIQCHEMNHFNKDGQPCHGSSFVGFRYLLGARLSWLTREWIWSMLGGGFSLSQIMVSHKKEAWECATIKRPCTQNTSIMPNDVYNMCKKHATELWQKHPRINIFCVCSIIYTQSWCLTNGIMVSQSLSS